MSDQQTPWWEQPGAPGENRTKEQYDAQIAALKEPKVRSAHKVMTPAEYASMQIVGWHEVCRDIDGFGGVGIRYLGNARSRP